MSRIEKNTISIQMNFQNEAARAEKAGQKEKRTGHKDPKKDTVIYAGNLMPNDRIEARKKQLQEKAMKVVIDQFEADSEVDAELKSRRGHIQDLKEEASRASEQMLDVKETQERLIAREGISEDELALLRKARKSGLQGLSEDERQQIVDMGGLTEDRSSILAYDDVIEHYQKAAEQAHNEIAQESRTVEQIKTGLLKQHGMSDAVRTKEEMSLEAAKEVAGMLFEEAKKNIEKEWQEMLEKAEEAAEKKEEKEELLEKAAEKNEQTQEKTEEISEKIQEDVQEVLDMSGRQDTVKLEVDKLLQESGLLEEELKGILIDQHT